MKKRLFLIAASLTALFADAQLTVQNGASLTIEAGAILSSNGDISAHSDIAGTGNVEMKSTIQQQLNMNGNAIQNLVIDNHAGIALAGGAVRISNSLVFMNGIIRLGNQNLILDNNASVSGYNAEAYVSTDGTGKLSRYTGITAQVFPVGTTDYSPVIISNSGTADDLSIRVITGMYADGISGTQLTERGINRTWLIDEAVPGGSDATISLQWNLTDELPFFNTSATVLSHYHNGQWDPGVPQAVSYQNNNASVSRTGITSFSPFAVASTGSVVPVTLLDFTASIHNKTTVASWSTSSEINSSRFELERSQDGSRYYLLGTVNAAGTSSTPKNYAYIDTHPYPLNYYRLKMLDLDGHYNYSRTVIIKFNDNNGLQVFPNPVKDILYAQANGYGEAMIYITDATGRKVKESKVSLYGSTSFSIDVSGMASGMYNLVLSGIGRWQQKFIKE